MATQIELLGLLAETSPLREFIENARQYPVDLLRRICASYARTGQPVADHQLGLGNNMAEMALRTLLSAGLVEVESPHRHFLHTYRPTEKAMDYYNQLEQKQADAKGAA